MGGFPKRYRQAHCPNYEDADFKVLANPIGTLYSALLEGTTETEESAASLGAALVEAYGGGVVEAYGVRLDFSTADAAIATLQNEAIPVDLRVWLRNAPTELVTFERTELLGNGFRASLTVGI